jgi:hypothetical protein
MKLILYTIVAGFYFYLTSCRTEKNKSDEIIPLSAINFDTIHFEHSMKGWELYSWPNGHDWNYSLLIGTNVLKNYNTVTQQPIKVTGIDSLKMLLPRLPSGEDIFWIGDG